MSDMTQTRHRDAGLTLPELLITVSILGLIVAVITATITVTFRQQASTTGRVNVARAEQNIGFYMPNDLASASEVDTDPAISPCESSCPPGVDLSGSNALLLTWTTSQPNSSGTDAIDVLHNVSYHYLETDQPGVYEVNRIECESVNGAPYTCNTARVLGDLAGPPGSAQFFPGSTVPTWVLQVSEPLAPDAVNDSQYADAATRKDANRVVVTVNGGGSGEGSGGGINQISITAGGTSRDEIPADSVFNAPTFTEARSRCGGPLTLIIDDSNSISETNISTVRDGVVEFAEALAGTPTKIQVVRFDSTASVLGTSGWTRYYDMTDPSDVAALTDSNGAVKDITKGGGTNWEDAWFRTFYNPDGTFQDVLPDTVVFFTDGIPTYERSHKKADPGQLIPNNPPTPGPGWPMYDASRNRDDDNGIYFSGGWEYSQVAFNRTDWIVDEIRSGTRIVGVGVGDAIENGSADWIGDPGAWFHYDTYRGYRQYQEQVPVYERATYRYQRGYHYNSRGRRRYSAPYTNWRSTNVDYYNSHNTTSDSSDGYRKVVRYWSTITESSYNANNTTSDSSDGYRVGGGGWDWISASDYSAGNTTGDETDGFRDAGRQYVSSNSDALDWELWPTQQSGGGYSQQADYDSSHRPHTHQEPGVVESTPTRTILSRLIAGNDHAVEGLEVGGEWTNVEVAELFVLENFSTFVSALKAIALGDCGGTVTLSTRMNGSLPTPDPVTFQNSKVFDTLDQQLPVEPTVVYTNRTFPAGTFDFSIPDGDFVTVEIVPENLSDLVDYSPAGWSCKVGNTAITPGVVAIPDSTWTGVSLTIRANEAVSCILAVTR